MQEDDGEGRHASERSSHKEQFARWGDKRLDAAHQPRGSRRAGASSTTATTKTNEQRADHVLSPTCSVCIPALVGAGANAYMLWNEHWEHWSHMPPLEERVEYPYQNIR